jgi:hypothetical protein
MNKYGYIYIGGDRSKAQQTKVGKTIREPNKRISETTNPDYYLYHSYRVAAEDLSKVEKAIHKKISKSYKRIKFVHTNRNSEWFECSTQEADDICAEYFEKEQTRQKKELEEKANLESFNQDKRDILHHFTYYYHPVLKEFYDLENNYKKRRSELEKELLPSHQTSQLNFFGIPAWLFSNALIAFIVSLFVSTLSPLSSLESFFICFIIFAIYNREALEIIKIITNKSSLQEEVDTYLCSSIFTELSAKVSALNSYEKSVRVVTLGKEFPSPPYKPEDLTEQLRKVRNYIENAAASDEPCQITTSRQILGKDQVDSGNAERTSIFQIKSSSFTTNSSQAKIGKPKNNNSFILQDFVDEQRTQNQQKKGQDNEWRWYHWLILYLVIKTLFILGRFGDQIFQ